MTQDQQMPFERGGEVQLSLIISTLGRSNVIDSLLDSLRAQSFKDFEVIIVDQNGPGDIVRVDAADYPFKISHHGRPADRGLSRGRNVGWRLAAGRFILFPDDDCIYPEGFLELAISRLRDGRCDVLAGRARTRGRFATRAQRIDRRNAWTTSIEWATFYRRDVLAAVGGFDERLGVGAPTPWQSAEGQDILLRAIEQGFVCWFDPALQADYLQPGRSKIDRQVRRRARAYGRGMGFVLRKHEYALHSKAWWIVRALAGSVMALFGGRIGLARYRADVALGRLEGVLGRTFGPAISWQPDWTA